MQLNLKKKFILRKYLLILLLNFPTMNITIIFKTNTIICIQKRGSMGIGKHKNFVWLNCTIELLCAFIFLFLYYFKLYSQWMNEKITRIYKGPCNSSCCKNIPSSSSWRMTGKHHGSVGTTKYIVKPNYVTSYRRAPNYS
jgi:hypothetical protein